MSKEIEKENTTLNEVVRLNQKQVSVEMKEGNRYCVANIPYQDYHQKLKIKIDESELIRILKTLNPDNKETDGSQFSFVKDLLVLKVGGSYKDYSNFAEVDIIEDIGKLVVNVTIKQDDGTDKIIETKIFKRKICASGHNRSQKVMFIAGEIYSKVDDILLCEIDPELEFIPSKFNAYDGLVATDSKVVSMPNIVVVDDYQTNVKGNYDVVTMTSETKKQKPTKKGKTEEKEITEITYSVDNDKAKEVEIIPFDGAGLVSVACAQQWAKELKKDYTPASFQFRCLAGLKGNLFTFDIDEFCKINSTKITDIWGKQWDFVDDKIDVIMTKSQFKFYKLYQDETKDYGGWKEAFDEELYGYKRTFNISEVAEECKDLKDFALMSYQPLQTLQLSDYNIMRLCAPTVKMIEALHSSVDAFLKYRNIREFEEVESDENETKNVCQEWDYTPPYYKALLYNRSLFNDEYIKGKVKRDIKMIIRKACMGKISVKGNYQTLAPDIYGLAQYAFGGKVTGLIGKNEIYSNYWWNGQFNKFYNDKRQVWYAAVGEVDLLRNPHIANEHCPVKVVSNQEMAKWYKYQTVNILTGFKDTNVMKLNGADFDGDHVLTVNNSIIIEAAKANVANTIVLNKKVISDVEENDAGSDNRKQKSGECKISDVKMLIKTDKIGFQNNIGNVVNRISLLWSLEQTPEVQEFIKIMSIIGSLTIDFVKTGIKVDIPKNIKSLITVGKHKKPYFMQYGSASELRKSKTIKKETERLGMLELISAQKEKYDNTDCVMNKICHHMESQLLNLRVEDTNKVFDYTTLLTSEVNPYNETYKSLKVKLLDLQKEFTEICKKYSNLDEDEQKDFGQRQYQRFYSYCKVELQSIYYDKMRSVDNHKIVDCLIYMFYFDKDVMAKCADKSILWNTFTSEMLQRSKENIKPTRCDCFKLNERRDKSIKAVAKLKENSRKIGATYFDNAPKSTFTKDDKKELKKKIKDEDARNILFVLIILSRKLQPKEPIEVVRSGKNKINRSRICKLAGVDVRNYEKAIKQLMDKGLIIIDCSDVLKQKYYVNFEMNDGESCAEIESVNTCIQAVNNDFNYLKKA